MMTSTAFGAHNCLMNRASLNRFAAAWGALFHLGKSDRIAIFPMHSLYIRHLLLFFILSPLPLTALAWNAAGHRLVAHIAWEQLEALTRAEVTRLLQGHPDHALWVKRAKDAQADRGAFVEASTWPDDIRQDQRFYHAGMDDPTPLLAGFPDMQRHSDWHYVNLRLDGSPDDPPLSGRLGTQLMNLLKTLAIRNTSAVDRSYALPWIIHLVGDAHQPLHTCVRTGANGKWDALGQGMTISNPFNPRKNSSTLHAFWDDLPGPPWLRGERLQSTARSLVSNYPPMALSASSETWIAESWQIAREHGYPTSHDDPPTITADFFEDSREITRRRVTQAGYRLAELLNAALRQ